jgi:exopolysaccharide biosynthesis polyprenyl glycosylphosphotransferase
MAAKRMLGRKQELNLQFQQITDGLLLSVAFWLAHTIRYTAVGVFEYPIAPFSDFQWLLFVIMPFGPIILELQGFYSHPAQKTLARSLHQIAQAAFWLGLLIAACAYFLQLEVPSRAVMPIFAVIGLCALLVRERITVLRYRRQAEAGELREPVLLVGTVEDLEELKESLPPELQHELEIVAEIDPSKQPVQDLVKALHEHSVSRVIFTSNHADLSGLQEFITACEVEGVEAWLMADFIRTAIARPDFDVLAGRPVLVIRTTPALSWALLVKGLIDRSVALLAILVGAPLFVLIALLVRISSPGPIIFRQERAGRHGRPFVMYKFRTMVTDAAMQQDELKKFNQMSGPVFKMDRDPRVTPIGRLLRKTSLDELPQFFNILRGDMSLVGPRPLPLYEVARFETPSQRRRLSMKPGLTCLWQVSGRNKVTSFEQWVKLDLEYIDNWSLWLDVRILLKTVPVVLCGVGAR